MRVMIFAFLMMFSAGGAMAEKVSGVLNGRPYSLISPPNSDGKALPLLVAVHSALSSEKLFQKKFPMSRQVDKGNFRVVYVNGTVLPRMKATGRSVWNAGECCGPSEGVDDVSYIASVIDYFVKEGLADRNQVFLLGHSNGAMMSYRFICERANMVRGLVAISGPLAKPTCANASGVSVLHIHGGRDENVPVNGGGTKGISGNQHRSLQHTQAALVNAGAKFDVQILDRAEHDLRGINRAYVKTYRKTLPIAVAQFMGR